MNGLLDAISRHIEILMNFHIENEVEENVRFIIKKRKYYIVNSK